MATTLIRFELAVLATDIENNEQAYMTLLNALATLGAQIYIRNEARMITDGHGYFYAEASTVYTGFLTSSQVSNALTALNTYNSAIGHNTPCDTVTVSSQP